MEVIFQARILQVLVPDPTYVIDRGVKFNTAKE